MRVSRRLILALAVLAVSAGSADARPGHKPKPHPRPHSDTYVNVDGDKVRSPVKAANRPPDASAHCRDGSYSFSRHHQGTCSHHGGVAEWYQ